MTTSPGPSRSSAPWRTAVTTRTSGPRRSAGLAELPDREPHDPVVGRPRALDGAHGLPATQVRHSRSSQRIRRAERSGDVRADRRPDLHRCLGDGVARRSGAGGCPRPDGGQGQPRRRGRSRRHLARGDGSPGLRRREPRPAARYRAVVHPARLGHRPGDRRPSGLARRRTGLAGRTRTTCRQVRL